ncbi:MAG: ATP-binding cassette domain-containing protein [Candidatus Lokiarchaeota archaeon]|nr:ATP-binding cassette domain-containing protein [Candidatus Lokiarchaeota archaeon]
MSEVAIKVSNLKKRFEKIQAVNDISFQVKKGEFFGFLGPNGAGKTTTIRILTGILKPNSGDVNVTDINVLKQPSKAKEKMGIVPEISNVYMDMSAWDNLMFMGKMYALPKEQRIERATKLLKRFELYGRRNDLAKKFSKGMKKRLLICMALLNRPEILFLDEPTSGLDVESQRIIRQIIRKYNEDGITVFLTTHNLEEANRLCDRVAIINNGKILEIDTPETLKLKSKKIQSIDVKFDKVVELNALKSELSIKSAKKVGDLFRLYTNDQHTLFCKLVDYVREQDLRLLSVKMLVPSLEDVFVQVIKKQKMGAK